MNFKDIPQFTSDGNYRVDICLRDLIYTMDRYQQKDDIDMNPDFQRGHVWDSEKQIAFVEFMLRGGKSARMIYLNHPNWMTSFEGRLTLVDGKQRLTAALKFMNNELQVFDGNYFKDFTGGMTFFVGFTFCINDLKTRAEVLQWYLDLNAGGVVHTNEEIEKVRNLLDKEKKKKQYE